MKPPNMGENKETNLRIAADQQSGGTQLEIDTAVERSYGKSEF